MPFRAFIARPCRQPDNRQRTTDNRPSNQVFLRMAALRQGMSFGHPITNP